VNLALRSKKKNGNEMVGAEIDSRTEKYMRPHGFKGLLALGDSRKYPYHTMDSCSEFWGQGGGVVWTGIPKAWGGDTYEWNSEGMGRGLDLGFTQEKDKNVFLESAFFMDVLNQFVNRARIGDISQLRQLCRRSRMQDKHWSTDMCSFSLGKPTKCRFYFKLQRPYVD